MTTIENRQTIFATKSTINFDPPYPSKQIPACTISERPMLHRENKSHILKIHNLNVIQDLFWYPHKGFSKVKLFRPHTDIRNVGNKCTVGLNQVRAVV